MIEDHWKSKLLLSLLPFLFLGVPKECHGQAGGGNGNFFYYYSPTQRTNFNHGLPTTGTGQFFNNPFLNQQNHPAMTQNVPNQQLPQPQPQPQSSIQQFPSFQQSTLLGFNHPNFQQQQTQQSPAFQQAPPSQFQFPSIQPTPVTQPPQQQFLPQTSPTFSTFTIFGPNAQFFGSRNAPIPQPSQSPLGTVAPGAFNFFQSPFQFLQQRFLQDTTPTAVSPTLSPMPEMHSVPTAPTTTAVPPNPPAPTPTEMMMDSPALEQVIERRPAQKFSSRFRYVQQPPLQPQQYNPYTRLGSPYTSDLPYMEQRFYSSPTSPTGYAYSLGGDQGSGATSTVHFSKGPLNKINQYLTEVSATRRLLQRQRTEHTTAPVQAISVPETTNEMAAQDEEVLPQNAPSSPEPTMSTTMAPSTTTDAPTPAPAPSSSSPEPMPVMEEVPAAPVPESMDSTLEPLINEPSLQTETITAPVVEIHELPTARKASETSISKRLVIRKKVARKRLRLDGSGEVVNTDGAPMPVGVMIRRIFSSNRLPTEETKVLEDESPKGLIASIPATTPSTTTTTTTEATLPEQMAPEMQPEEEHDDQRSQDLQVEPQQSSSPQPMIMPVDESQMMAMEEKQEEPQEPIQPMNMISSATPAPSQMSEEMPAMQVNQPKEMPQPVEEIMSSTTTTAAPIQPPPVEALMSHESQPVQQNDAEEYFEDYYEDDDAPLPSHPGSDMSNPQGHSRIMTAVKAPESDDEPPVLNGVQKGDFPGVFHQNASTLDNSVESDQGEVITRITSSHPSDSAEVAQVNMPTPESSPMTMTIPQNSTTEASQPEFMREDPVEEQPPKETEVPATPAFEPTSEANVPMMTTTPTPMKSSTAPQEVSSENPSKDQEDESLPMLPEEAHLESSSSTTEQPEGRMEQMMGTTMSTSTEGTPQQDSHEMTHNEAELPELMSDPVMSVSSTTESIMMSSNADEDSTSMPQMELANPSSTEIASSSSSPSSQEQQMNIDDSQSNNSQENFDENSEGHQPNSEEQALDSEEIGKVQRLALEETLKRLRERQQTSSTNDPTDDGENSPENDVQMGRRMFSRRPLQVSNLPLPTAGPAVNSNAVLHEDEGVERSQVVENIQRFRAKYGRTSTTTKKPRRVTRPSPSTERRLAVVSPVEDLVGSQEQVDSFSDSSFTPGAVEVTTTQPSTTPMPYMTTTMTSFRTTPSSTTTMLPFLEESSTTSAPTSEEEEMNNPTYSTTSTTTTTESYEYEQQTTRQPPQTLTTLMTESTTQSSNDEFSSTTETDFETITERVQPANELTRTTDRQTTTATEASMMMTMTMTTTPPPALMESATTPSTTTSTTTYATMTDFSDDNKDMPKNDYDVFYSEEENMETAKNIQVSSSSETSTAAADDDDEMESSSQSSSSSTTIAPLSTSTDTTYVMTTTSEPNSGSAATTTMNPDIMTTTSAGQLIIHEIVPTMPPLKEVSFVIGESVEDDQSAAVDNISKAETSDELLAADKAVVRVETNVHVSTNATTDFDTSSSVEQSSEELTQPQPLNSTTTMTSAEQGQRRVRIVVKRQRRLRRPNGGAGGSGGPGQDGRRRRRKVYHRRPQ